MAVTLAPHPRSKPPAPGVQLPGCLHQALDAPVSTSHPPQQVDGNEKVQVELLVPRPLYVPRLLLKARIFPWPHGPLNLRARQRVRYLASATV
ncbi:unnamed protein product [Lota lota]